VTCATRPDTLALDMLRFAGPFFLVGALVASACSSAPLEPSDGEGVEQPEAAGPSAFPRLGGSHAATCNGLGSRLRDCELLSEGPVRCTEPTTREGKCQLGCLTQASCAHLWDAYCRVVPDAITRCFQRCTDFKCGDGLVVPGLWVCDTEDDCADGSDEADCPAFVCGSGETIPDYWECDTEADCRDGSDEVDCPLFTCDNGQNVPESWRCDWTRDCADGTDERGCPVFTCASDGEILPPDLVCNLRYDCLDGSDEVGCGELVCR
jgi:hypothetical protein